MAHGGLFFKLPQKPNILWMKNLVKGPEENIFEEGRNGMRRHGIYKYVGTSARKAALALLRTKRGDEYDDYAAIDFAALAARSQSIELDRMYKRKVAMLLMGANPGDEEAFKACVVKAVQCIRRDEYGEPMESSAVNKRMKSLRESNLITGPMWAAFEGEFDRTKPNRGNANASGGPTGDAIRQMDVELARHVLSKEYFFCWNEETPKVMPDEGTLITSDKCEDGMYEYRMDGGEFEPRELRFSESTPFVELTLSGLRIRVNGSKNHNKGKGKGKNNHIAKMSFDRYKLETPWIPQPPGPGQRRSLMANTDTSKVKSYNKTHANVVLVRFVWKGWKEKKTEEDRLAELNELCRDFDIVLNEEEE